MPANGRWDLIRRLKVKLRMWVIEIIIFISWLNKPSGPRPLVRRFSITIRNTTSGATPLDE